VDYYYGVRPEEALPFRQPILAEIRSALMREWEGHFTCRRLVAAGRCLYNLFRERHCRQPDRNAALRHAGLFRIGVEVLMDLWEREL